MQSKHSVDRICPANVLASVGPAERLQKSWGANSLTLLPLLSGKKAAAAAVTAAYEDNLDTAVALGWSYVERIALEGFVEELSSAPAAAAGALRQLAVLYGLTRIERGMAFFLASGALEGAHAAMVRRHVNAGCRSLAADKGRALRQLCDGFGIPDELIHAPIAKDWRTIGLGPGAM